MQYKTMNGQVIEVRTINRIGGYSPDFEVAYTEIADGIITPEMLSEKRLDAHSAGFQLKIKPTLNNSLYIENQIVQCKFCERILDWDEAGWHTKSKNYKRKDCSVCFQLVYGNSQYNAESYRQQQYEDRIAAREYALGGWFWSYVICILMRDPKPVYVGATANLIQRIKDHTYRSHNQTLRGLIDFTETQLSDMFALNKVVMFNPYGHETIEEAFEHERYLYDYYNELEGFILDQRVPTGFAPLNLLRLWEGWSPKKS